MDKTFAQCFADVVNRIQGPNKAQTDNLFQQMEIQRVHQESVYDKDHAYAQVEIPKPRKPGFDITI